TIRTEPSPDEFAVIAIGEAMLGGIGPQVAGLWRIDVRNAVVESDFVGDHAAEIVSPFMATICDLPVALVVVAGDGGSRPDVAVAGDFSAIVEVVEDAELAGKFVFVGCEFFPVHSERRIAVADAEAAKYLIVGAIFLDGVDHVLDGILAAAKQQFAWGGAHQVPVLDLSRKVGEILFRFGQMDAGNGTVEESRDIRMFAATAALVEAVGRGIGPGTLPLGGCHQQIAPLYSESAGIPVGGNE